MSTKLIVKQPDPPSEAVAAEVIATSIVKIAEGMKAIGQTRLSQKAIVTLIHAQSKVARRDIEIVLNNLQDLERDWLKPKV